MTSHIRNIVVSYASYGSGHKTAAEALATRWKIEYPHDNVFLIDALLESSRLYRCVSRYFYSYSTKYIPLAYRMYYNFGNSHRFVTLLRELYWISTYRLVETSVHFDPRLIICTHPLPMAVLARYKKHKNSKWLLSAIITDYGINRQWISPQTDFYFVGNKIVKEKLETMGIKKERIMISGIPIKNASIATVGRWDSDRELLPRVCLLAHGLNPNYALRVFSQVLNCKTNCSVLANYGNSSKTRQLFESFAKNRKRDYELSAFDSDFSAEIASFSLLLTKPGGLTVTEALANRVPLILLKAYPGQEESNAKFLLETGFAFMPPLNKISETIDLVLDHSLHARMAEPIIGTPDSGAAHYIVEELGRSLR